MTQHSRINNHGFALATLVVLIGIISVASTFFVNTDTGSVKLGTTFCYPEDGCTGTSTKPLYGQLLVGNSSGTYTLTATSALGIIGASDGSWSTTSADYWETAQTDRTADDLTNNSIEDLNDVTAITENWGDLFYWNGTSWADLATSSLGVSWDDLRSIPAGFADGVDNTGSGGAGLATSTAIADTWVIYGTSPSDVGAESAFNYDDALDKLTVVNASTTYLSATTLFGNLTGLASLATALNANGSNCSAGSFPLGVDASGAIENCTDAWTEAENTSAAYISRSGVSATYPISYNNGTGVFSWLGLSTSSAPVISGLPVWTSSTALGTVATGTLTENATGLEFNATGNLVGSAAVLSLTTGYGIPLTASTTNWNTFYDTPSNRITAGDALTWSGNTLNFDGGNTPSGDLGGTWASPSVSDDSHAHTSASISGLDISADTNLAVTYPVVLTNDTVSLAFGTTTANNWSLLQNFTTATATNFEVVTGINLFGGGLKTTANALCIQLTGSADLCDGTDAEGAGGGWATTSSDYWATTDLKLSEISDVQDGGSVGDVLYWNGSLWATTSTSTWTHALVTLAGQDYLTLSGQQITAGEIQPDDLANADFGEFGCNGTTCTLDSEVYSIQELSDVTDAITENLGDLLYWNGTLWADIATSSLNISTTDTVEGTKLYYTDLRVGTYINGSTSLTIATTTVTGSITVNGGATSTFPRLSVTTAFNFLGDYITNVLTWFDTKIEALTAVVLQGTWDFGGATSIEVVNGTNPTVDTVGEIALDTTDDQLLMADGGGTVRVMGHDEWRVISVTVASTSVAFTSGQTLPALSHKDGLEITQFTCYVVGGTSKVINLTDGTNDTETITCGTTLTQDTDVATNDTFTAGELGYMEFGATTGTVNYLHFEAYARITRE